MKKVFVTLLCMVSLTAMAQTKSVSILGDSYSTFDGYVTPSTNEMWYYQGNRGNNDVEDVTQTWWWQFIKNNGYRLCVNNSWSGATIGYYGYDGNDYSSRSFITRSLMIPGQEHPLVSISSKICVVTISSAIVLHWLIFLTICRSVIPMLNLFF